MRTLLLALVPIALVSSAGAPARASTVFAVTNLVTDDQSAHAAQITDARLVDPRGIAYDTIGAFSVPGGFWVADNATGVATVYSVDPATQAASTSYTQQFEIVGDGSVTGAAFSETAASFHGDNFLFLFASEDGAISGWRLVFGFGTEYVQFPPVDTVYTGLTVGTISGDTYLYAANFQAGLIDVLASDGASPFPGGRFTDPSLPSGYAPFDILNLGGTLYVSYAVQNAGGTDHVPGAGHGIVDTYDLAGNFVARVATGGALNSPWGLAIAPSSFGEFAGRLLVGNAGDGTISAYDLAGSTFAGQLTDGQGDPLVIDGLWGLTPGNDVFAGSSGSIYFTAGPDGGTHGLFGVIQAVPEPGSTGLLSLALAALAFPKWRRAG